MFLSSSRFQEEAGCHFSETNPTVHLQELAMLPTEEKIRGTLTAWVGFGASCAAVEAAVAVALADWQIPHFLWPCEIGM